MSTRPRAEANPARCPDCGVIREHASASCDLCAYDPDRFVTDHDATWADGSPATQLHAVGTPVPEDNPAPPAELVTVAKPGAARWWGWLTLTLAVAVSWLARGCS